MRGGIWLRDRILHLIQHIWLPGLLRSSCQEEKLPVWLGEERTPGSWLQVPVGPEGGGGGGGVDLHERSNFLPASDGQTTESWEDRDDSE